MTQSDPAASAPEPDQVTRILRSFEPGRAECSDQLLPLVYAQLRAIAQRHMAQERSDHTLQATALVHEAYLRLVGDADIGWDSRGHFFASAAEAIRRILIEHARARGRVKRGGPPAQRRRLPLSVVDLACESEPEEIMALDAAICRLQEQDPRAAQVVRLRFFAGLSIEETAAAMNLSPRTVKRDWELARAWLYEQLQPDEAD